MIYTVFGYCVGGIAKFKDDIHANSTRDAICKAYDMHGEKYTLYKVYNSDGVLVADSYKIYSKFKNQYITRKLTHGTKRRVKKVKIMFNIYGRYFYGNEISAYGIDNKRVDYATLAKSFDCVL